MGLKNRGRKMSLNKHICHVALGWAGLGMCSGVFFLNGYVRYFV